MARFIVIALYVVFFASFSVGTAVQKGSTNSTVNATETPQLECKDSETQDNCPVDCPSDYCPKNRYVNQSGCPNPKKCPPPACKCRFNYRRAANGSCIPTRDCPPFECDGENEMYDPCPPFCPGQNCSQATPDGKCHIFGRILIVLQCKPACRCKMNYWRLNGRCVPYSQCPRESTTVSSVSTTPSPETTAPETTTQRTFTTTSSPKCPDNEIVDNCPADCASNYCPKSRYDDQSFCPNPDKCPPAACRCGFNQRRSCNGTCIPTRSCPPFECDGENEMHDPCPPYCPGQNCSQATPDGKCHIFGHILIVLQCKPACRCKMNYWRLNGRCVPYSQCPNNNNTITTTTMRTTTNPPKKCEETDIDSPKRNTECNYQESEKTDRNEDWDDQDTEISEPSSDCGCDETDIDVPQYNRDSDCGCDDTETHDSGDCDNNDDGNTDEQTSDCECNDSESETDIPEEMPYWKRCEDDKSKSSKNCSCEETTQSPPTCKDSEILDDCPVDCPSDYCPKSRYDDQSACPKPEKCPPPACKCRFNYRRAKNGTCIPTETCPPFACDGYQEQYNSCPAYCPGESCSQATPDGECHAIGNILIVVSCQPACRCRKTYWRLNGACVSYAECRKCLDDNTTNSTVSITKCQ